jgi:hydrogenase maturation protein HypF
VISFEGQAAMNLEFLISDHKGDAMYPYDLQNEKFCVLEWAPMIKAIVDEVNQGVPIAEISIKFHNTIVEAAVDIVRRINKREVVLSGGCFQNRYLTERLIRRLREENFNPHWHQWIPPNDGGISLGQAVCVANQLKV